jgi:hypothetical protein
MTGLLTTNSLLGSQLSCHLSYPLLITLAALPNYPNSTSLLPYFPTSPPPTTRARPSMEDKDKGKCSRPNNVPRNASSSRTPTPSRDLPSHSGIYALLLGNSGLVQSLEDARSWLDKKG